MTTNEKPATPSDHPDVFPGDHAIDDPGLLEMQPPRSQREIDLEAFNLHLRGFSVRQIATLQKVQPSTAFYRMRRGRQFDQQNCLRAEGESLQAEVSRLREIQSAFLDDARKGDYRAAQMVLRIMDKLWRVGKFARDREFADIQRHATALLAEELELDRNEMNPATGPSQPDQGDLGPARMATSAAPATTPETPPQRVEETATSPTETHAHLASKRDELHDLLSELPRKNPAAAAEATAPRPLTRKQRKLQARTDRKARRAPLSAARALDEQGASAFGIFHAENNADAYESALAVFEEPSDQHSTARPA